MKKHAYLILAHNDFYIFEKLIKLLDDERNDIFVHIDKKVKDFNFEYYRTLCNKSNLFFVNRYDIRWGASSLIKAEMELFKRAFTNNNYYMYHLLSGVDIPIKSQDYIHNFFDNNAINLIDIYDDAEIVSKRADRVKYYHLFNQLGVNKRGIGRINKIALKIQKILGVDRIKNNYKLKFGSQWVSLNSAGTKYLIENESWIKKYFMNGHCADELFIQSLFGRNNKIQIADYKRMIEWESGDSSPHPHTFTIDDKDRLMSLDALFARKFSSKKDKQIIDYLYETLKV